MHAPQVLLYTSLLKRACIGGCSRKPTTVRLRITHGGEGGGGGGGQGHGIQTRWSVLQALLASVLST